jgi:hypothetical protein
MPKVPKMPHRGVGPYGPEAKIVERAFSTID